MTSTLGFHPAGELHSDSWHERGGRCLHLEFSGPWIERVRESSLVLNQPIKFQAGTPIRLAERLYRELRSPDDLSPMAIEGLALELLA